LATALFSIGCGAALIGPSKDPGQIVQERKELWLDHRRILC